MISVPLSRGASYLPLPTAISVQSGDQAALQRGEKLALAYDNNSPEPASQIRSRASSPTEASMRPGQMERS
ncbi:MAG: hypothetical protein J7L35_02915 [Anaerolineales bacterium]|nr:hypothetical protein [Anaerolineales bacterium]